MMNKHFLALVLGALLLAAAQHGHAQTEVAWEAAIAKNTIEAYEQFIRKYPASPNTAVAEERLNSCLRAAYEQLSRETILDLPSLRRLASLNESEAMMLENIASIAANAPLLSYSLSGGKLTYEQYLDRLAGLAERGGRKELTLQKSPFDIDEKSAYKLYVQLMQRTRDRWDLTPLLERHLRVARWRLALLDGVEIKFDEDLSRASDKDAMCQLINRFWDYRGLIRRARQKLEDILISEARKPGAKHEFVLPDVLPVEGSYSARVSLLGSKDSEYGFILTEYPNDGPISLTRGIVASAPLGDGSVHRYKGESKCLVAQGNRAIQFRFAGEPDDPLTFLLSKGVGYIYLHGRGTVVFPDGMKRTFSKDDVCARSPLSQTEAADRTQQRPRAGGAGQSDDPEICLIHGNARYDLANYDAAIALFTKAISLNSKYAEAYSRRGEAFAAKGSYEVAIADFDKAISLDPKNPVAHVKRGQTIAKGLYDYPRAIADFDKAITLDFSFNKAYFYRGYLNYMMENAPDKALSDFKLIANVEPKSAEDFCGRAFFIFHQPFGLDDSENLREKIARLDPARVMSQVLADLNKSVSLNPELVEAHVIRGRIRWSPGDNYEAAIADLGIAIELDPRCVTAYYERGVAYGARKEYPAAFADLEKAIALDSTRPDFYLSLGMLREKVGKWAEASAAYRKPLDLIPDGNARAMKIKNRIRMLEVLGSTQPITAGDMQGLSGEVTAIALAPDGRSLAAATKDGMIRIIEPRTGELRRILSGHKAEVLAVAFSGDGRTLVSGSADKNVGLWDARSGNLKQELVGHRGPVASVAISRDGKTIAGGSQDRTLKIWDARNGNIKFSLPDFGIPVNAIVISPDGNTLASACDRLVDARSGDEMDSLFERFFNRSVAKEGEAALWDLTTGKKKGVVTGLQGSFLSLAFSPDGRTLAIGSGNGTISLFDVNQNKVGKILTGHSGPVTALSFSPDGKQLASGGEARDIMESPVGGEIMFWDLQTGDLKRVLTGHKLSVAALFFSPDGGTLFSLGRQRLAPPDSLFGVGPTARPNQPAGGDVKVWNLR